MILLHDAIQSLRPGIGFSMVNDDPSTIVWDNPKTKTPSKEEIDAAFQALIIKAEEEKARIANEKQAVLNKLGLTEEELEVVLA